MRSFMRPFYSVLNSRIIVWVLAVWIPAIATPAFSSANLASASKTTSMANREVVDDLDPKGTLDCASLGELDCDALDGANSCEGLVQICGPVGGTYKLEVIAQRSTA